jgi:hypothetical protein
MSRSRQRVDALRQICGLRDVAAKLAGAVHVAAANGVKLAAQRKVAKEDSLRETVSGWEQTVAATRFDPQSALFWGHAINNAVSEVQGADGDLARCNESAAQAERKMARCVAEQQCADSLLVKSVRKHQAAIEDRSMAELADRFTRAAVGL